jgi:hypothetical protein
LPAPEAEVPLGVVTVTATMPAASGGDVAVMDVSEFTVKLAAATAPKYTLPAPVKALPVIVTEVPPAVVPEVVPRLVTDGVEARVKVYRSPLTMADVPLNVVTVTLKVPAA